MLGQMTTSHSSGLLINLPKGVAMNFETSLAFWVNVVFATVLALLSRINLGITQGTIQEVEDWNLAWLHTRQLYPPDELSKVIFSWKERECFGLIYNYQVRILPVNISLGSTYKNISRDEGSQLLSRSSTKLILKSGFQHIKAYSVGRRNNRKRR